MEQENQEGSTPSAASYLAEQVGLLWVQIADLSAAAQVSREVQIELLAALRGTDQEAIRMELKTRQDDLRKQKAREFLELSRPARKSPQVKPGTPDAQ